MLAQHGFKSCRNVKEYSSQYIFICRALFATCRIPLAGPPSHLSPVADPLCGALCVFCGRFCITAQDPVFPEPGDISVFL